VKVGDLGISVKLDPTDASGDAPKYLEKGLTTGYVSKEYEQGYFNDKELSRN